MNKDNIVNKGISMCFVKMARIDGAVGQDEIKNINSSKI